MQPASIAVEPAARSEFTRRLATPVMKYLEGRGLLIEIEVQEALHKIAIIVVWLAIGAIAAFAGWLLLVASLMGALAMSLGWSWMKATTILGGAHLLVALTAALVTWNRVTTARWFVESLNELKKDRTWLKSQTNKI